MTIMLKTVPPSPRPVLQIGVIGHRFLPNADFAALGVAVGACLDHIRTAASAVLATAPADNLDLRCISSLAEGSDSILADAALARGFKLMAPLPFFREVYAPDFTNPAAHDTYQRLLGRAQTVYEIDGTPGSAENYLAAARILLEQSDMVVAIWDGAPERGIGGTAQVIREAAFAAIPVVIIEAAAPHRLRTLGDQPDADIAKQMTHWLTRLLTKPKQPGRKDFFGIYGKETRFSADWASRFNRNIERVLLFGNRTLSISPPQPTPPQIVPELLSATQAGIDMMIVPHLEAADRLAVRYGALYRSAVTLRYLAVLPATLAALLGVYATPLISRIGFSTQLLILVFTLLIAAIDSRIGWHRRFMDYRYIAEHLRQSRLLALFGATTAVPRPSEAVVASSWTDWHLREIVRSLGLINARATPVFIEGAGKILCNEAEQQREFYETRGNRFQKLADRLKHAGIAMFTLGIMFTMLRLGLGILDVQGALYGICGQLALIFPALAPVFFGLRSYNEFGRLSQRYDGTAHRLERLVKLFGLHANNRAKLDLVAREAVGVMLAEVEDWRELIKARDLSPY